MATIFYKVAEIKKIEGRDTDYELVIENEFETGKKWELDPFNDTGMSYTLPTCKQRITIHPTSRMNNHFRDYKNLSGVLDNALAAEFIEMFDEEPDMVMWFAKDELSYAVKHGKLI